VVIGLTGSFASGKDLVAHRLIEKGFAYVSLSDLIRDDLRAENLPITRENLINKANEVRKTRGASEWAKRAIEKAKRMGAQHTALVSIRNPAEVEELRKLPEFELWFIDSPQRIRYGRAKKRGRTDDFPSFEDFQAKEARENSADPAEQQLGKVFALADRTIENDSDIASLQLKIDNILYELGIG